MNLAYDITSENGFRIYLDGALWLNNPIDPLTGKPYLDAATAEVAALAFIAEKAAEAALVAQLEAPAETPTTE